MRPQVPLKESQKLTAQVRGGLQRRSYFDKQLSEGYGTLYLALSEPQRQMLEQRGLMVAKETRHLFFSYSKMVTATVFAQVWEREGFALDRPVREFLPNITGGGKDAITVRHVLTHSAGIPNADLTEVETAAGWDAFLAQLSKKDVEWKPGSKTAYHALSGHFLAAAIVSKLAGKSWERLCQELLFQPLGAKTLTFATPPHVSFLPSHLSPKISP